MRHGTRTRKDLVIIPCEADDRCACGATRVSVYRDGLENLIDNMGCELGLELVAGPLCPKCDGEKLSKVREARPPSGGRG